MPSQKDKAALF